MAGGNTQGGSMDRRITILRQAVGVNAYNEPNGTYTSIGQFWAARMDASAGERYRASEVAAELTVRFTLRYSSVTEGINEKDLLRYRGTDYNITGVRQKMQGRNAYIEIDCVARSDG